MCKYDTQKCKLAKFAQILGISNSTFKPTLVQKFSKIKVYITQVLPRLLDCNEIWILKRKNKKRLTSSKIKFFRITAEYTLFDHKRSEDILEELIV
jgi:hypothetical protein